MKKYRNYNWDALNVYAWEEIASYMDDDIREKVYYELAPCTATEFIARYLELDPEFEELAVSIARMNLDEGEETI